MAKMSVTWFDGRREPTGTADPRYPNGMTFDLAKGASKNCMVELPYPAKRCGQYLIKCEACGYTAIVTTAGRADDPRIVKVPCKPN